MPSLMLNSCGREVARSSCRFVERSRMGPSSLRGPLRYGTRRTYIRCQGHGGVHHISLLPERERSSGAGCANCCVGGMTPCSKATTLPSHGVGRRAASSALHVQQPSNGLACSLNAASVCLTVTAAAHGTVSTRPATDAPLAGPTAATTAARAMPFSTTELSPLTRAFIKASILRMLLLHTMWAAQYLLPAGLAGGALAPVALASGYLLLQQTGFWLKVSTDMSQAQDLMSSAWQQQVTTNSTLSNAGMHEWAVQLSALSAVTDPEMFLLLLRVPAFSALASVCMAAWAAAGAALSPAGYKPSCKDLAALGQQVFLLTAMANAMQQARGSLVEQLFRWEHVPLPGEGLGMAAAATAAAGTAGAAAVDSEQVTEISHMVTGREDALWDMIKSWCLAIQATSGGCSCPGGACPSACVDHLEQHWGAALAQAMGSHPVTQPLQAKGSAVLSLLLWDLVPARARAEALRRS